MHCKKCGAALPSRGFVCKSCGAMFDSDQIKKQKEYMRLEENKNKEVRLLSDLYSKDPIKRNYEKVKENKVLGAIFITLVLVILIILAILKVM